MSAQEPYRDGSVRRSRSAGDIPSRPERVHLSPASQLPEAALQAGDPAVTQNQISRSTTTPLSSHGSSSPIHRLPQARLDTTFDRGPGFSAAQPFQLASTETTRAAQASRRDSSPYVVLLAYFGLGRQASPARKSLVSLIWNLAWGFVQFVVIVTMLILTGSFFRSPLHPHLSEWRACDRPLGIWASIWVVRVLLASGLAYWEYVRERSSRASSNDRETGSTAAEDNAQLRDARPQNNRAPTNTATTSNSTEADHPAIHTLPYSHLYSRLTLLSSLMTLSWFLTAHILEYTSINTCRHSSPHLWWLVFGILCIMYLMVLEVVILGFAILIVAPILIVFWNIFLICVGRHPFQNPHVIKPEIGKLPKSVVDRIPLVMYIPPPPETPDGPSSIPTPIEPPHSYPPQKPVSTRRRFKLLRSLGSKKRTDSGSSPKDETSAPGADDQVSWEEHWEQGEYPFVTLEGNRAACAICLMDFEEPKKKVTFSPPDPGADDGGGASNINAANLSSSSEGDVLHIDQQLKLSDAGDGPQPLRLLACSHVFHKTCLDPWLTDVSGRCPVCQRPIEVEKASKRSRRRPG